MARVYRLPILILITIFSLIFALEPSSTSTAVPDPHPRLSPLDLQLRQEAAAADWAIVEPPAALPPAVVSGKDLPPEARRKLLAALPYGATMARVSEHRGVDGLLVAAIVEAESQFEPAAISPRGAVGLMQVRPALGRAYGADNLKDPKTNLDVGSRYLRSLLEDYNGDLRLTLAAYNAGPGAVARYRGIPPYRETRSYVRKVLNLYQAHHARAESASEPPTGFSLWAKGGSPTLAALEGVSALSH
jgi:soluble lytic murein transglycosylase-like protein